MKATLLNVQGNNIRILNRNGQSYISLTDMLKSKDGDFFISDWLRNRNTVEYLGIWETVNNPTFNYGEFAIIKTSAGLNSFKISAKDWIERTRSIGIISSTGRYGGTYAHVDIAFEFGMWISAEFKVYLIREFNRLKQEESKRLNSPWNLQRTLAKINYRIHTDAIKQNLVPAELNNSQISKVYANEADLLNVALYGLTAKEWRETFPEEEGNIRDHSSLEQLIVLSNLESLNAVLIEEGLPADERLLRLNKIAIVQMKSLLSNTSTRNLLAARVEEERGKYGLAS